MKKGVLEKLDFFFSKFKFLHYEKSEMLVRAGDPVFGIYFLKKGFVRQYVLSEDGEELTIHVYRPPAFFPTMLLLSNYPNKYYYEALTDIEVWRAQPDKVIEFLKQEPEVLFDLVSRFAAGLVGLSDRIEKLTLWGTTAKVASLLVYLASRFGETEGKEVVIQVPFTHKDVAQWLGITRETASRQIGKIEKKGLISYRNRLIVIKNLKKLKELPSYSPKRRSI